MAILSLPALKALFENGDFPDEQAFIDLIDTLAALPSGAGTYTKYVALLNQTGTDAPVVGPDLFTPSGPISNTLGGTLVWSYISPGTYRATLSGAFTAAKTWVSLTQGGTLGTVAGGYTSANTIDVFTADDTGTQVNDILNKTAIEIRVYP